MVQATAAATTGCRNHLLPGEYCMQATEHMHCGPLVCHWRVTGSWFWSRLALLYYRK